MPVWYHGIYERAMSGKKKKMLWLSLAIIIVAAAGIAAYFTIFNKANPPLPQNEVKIGNAVFMVEIASTTVQKARGLSYRTGLGAQSGMLFLFSPPGIQNFWMKDMNFSLDIIWIGPDASGTGEAVLGFAENAPPMPGVQLFNLPIYTSPDGTDKVLEVNAGTVAQYGIKVGDQVQIGI